MPEDLGVNFDPEFYKDPPPQYTEDTMLFLEELITLLNKYHFTFFGLADFRMFFHPGSKVMGIQRYSEGGFYTMNDIHEDKK